LRGVGADLAGGQAGVEGGGERLGHETPGLPSVPPECKERPGARWVDRLQRRRAPMADEDRTYQSGAVQSNRSAMQGNGFGQKDMDMQQQPSREEHATSPQRTEPFDNDPAGTGEARSFEADDDRNAAGADDDSQLGAGTPANVDVHKIGQRDNPEEDWGEAAGEGAVHSSNHTRRGEKTEAERGQGAKTRQHNKDIVSRRT
jgi:hypothetical protein